MPNVAAADASFAAISVGWSAWDLDGEYLHPGASPPPDFRRELVLAPKMACISLRFSKEFATATEPPRPGKGPKSVSEALLSLFDRTSPKLVLLKKVIIFQYLTIFAALPSS